MGGVPDDEIGETPEEAEALDQLADELEDDSDVEPVQDNAPVVTQEVVDAYRRQLHAAKRLLKVRKAREDLLAFTELSHPHPEDIDDPDRSRYSAQRHHALICRTLERVDRGELTRVIINIGPRHGKSELVSRRFPAWFLGRDGYRHVIVASYAEGLATDFGREVREVMRHSFYNQVFPDVGLRKGAQSVERIQTNRGGVANFVGVGGGITGKGADLLVIDDPISGAEQARSRAEREAQWNWFTKDAMTRLMGTMGRVVICMTRWHEDDIVGRLTNPKNPYYNAEEAAKWTVVNLTAFAEENDILGREVGEVMWPERITREFLEGQRRLDPVGFNALYMGRPSPPDGAHFRREMITPYTSMAELPSGLRFYAASDHAVSEAQRADRSCFGVVGVDPAGDIWILPDLVWGKFDTEAAVEHMLALGGRHRPLFWWAEKGHISKSIGPFLRKRMRETGVYFTVDEQTPVSDKVTRSQSIHGRMSMRMVHFPAFAHWYADAVDEMLAFPNGTHDDFVDWLSWIGRGIDRLHGAGTPVQEKPAPRTGTIQWIRDSSRALEREKNKQTRYYN